MCSTDNKIASAGSLDKNIVFAEYRFPMSKAANHSELAEVAGVWNYCLRNLNKHRSK